MSDWNTIDSREDLPHEPGSDHLWSETYLWTAYDPATRIGLYMHQGVTVFDPRLWRTTISCCLPNGDLLVAKNYGRAPDSRSAGSPVLHTTCDEPLERWRLRFDGAARIVTREESKSRLVSDGLPHRADIELTFEGSAPVFHPGEASWGRFHHDQPCIVRGRFGYGDQMLSFDGYGFRDHSMGPRDLSGFRGNDWCAAQFPSGRFFYVTEIFWDPVEHGLRRAFIWQDGAYRMVELKSMPVLEEAAIDPRAVRLSFIDSEGATEITGEIENVIRFTHKLPHELCLGTDLESTTTTDLAFMDAMTRYTWDGEVGYGVCEWIRPMSAARKVSFAAW